MDRVTSCFLNRTDMPWSISNAVLQVCRSPINPSCLRVCIHQGSNIITSNSDLDTANEVRQIDSLMLASKASAVAAYVATAETVSKDVIHGLNPNTSETELMDGLRTPFPGVEVLRVRMLCATRTAVLTINTRNAPRSVTYCGGEVPSYPFKPTKQVCEVCHQVGHRSDVSLSHLWDSHPNLWTSLHREVCILRGSSPHWRMGMPSTPGSKYYPEKANVNSQDSSGSLKMVQLQKGLLKKPSPQADPLPNAYEDK
ncbi:hypothetical protein V5799_025536 [Amblyomma americanum]|uniref:Uncharacterized protein n=1 Tax=Amblyomma americanum TaxID=6943 RepID=A0AAQ4E8Y8_AMBAM